MNPILELTDLIVNRGGRPVVEIPQMSVQEGEVLTIIGPNGAGKSTLLLALSGLLPPSQGMLRFQGKTIRRRANLEYRRKLSLVLQKPTLLNMSVLDNVLLGLRFRRANKNKSRLAAEEWLERFGIIHLLNRSSKTLSGGEAQRVSLARAFAAGPEMILLDEPFSALDAPTRTALLEEFQSLLNETGMTTLFVTHDMDEALHLGRRLGVLLDGRLRQIGAPDTVFSAPSDSEVAAFIGLETTVMGQVVSSADGIVSVEVGDHLLEAVGSLGIGRSVIFCIRPADVTLWVDDLLPASSARNRLSGTITKIAPRGPLVQVKVDCGFPVGVQITRSSAGEMELEIGKPVVLTFKASAVHLIPH